LKGIHIESACATNEICLNIQQVEKRESDQVKTMGSGMFLPKIFLHEVWLIMLNYHIFKKFKLIEIDKFNYLINTLTPSSRVGSNSLLIGDAQHTREKFNFK
jgi:hypothetical protein